MANTWRRTGRLLGIFLVALTGLTGALTLGGVASAHHPVLTQTVDRPCGHDAAWSGTVTAESDRDWNKDWRNRARIDAAPFGPWTDLTDDQVSAAFDVGPFAASVAQVTVRVQSQWFEKSTGQLSAGSSRTITLNRPDAVGCPTNPIEPTVAHDCATDTVVIIGADDTTTVDYTVIINQAPTGENTPWSVTITATPQPDYEFPPDTTTEWNFSGTVDCLTETTPTTPQLACEVDALAIQAAPSEMYTYSVAGNLGAAEGEAYDITVSVSTIAGYEFPEGIQTDWRFTGIVDCSEISQKGPSITDDTVAARTDTVQPAQQLPRTGSSTTELLLAYAAIVTLAGAGLLLVRRAFPARGH